MPVTLVKKVGANDIKLARHGGSGGIRTHEPVRTT